MSSLASSSSSSPSELSEGPASDVSSQASASGHSNQPDESGAAAALPPQVASGPKSWASPSAALTTPTPRITPMSNGPLPPG